METLLDKVKVVEQEAQQQIKQAEDTSKQEIADMLAHEKTMLAEVRQRAETRAEAVLKERITKDHNDVGQLVAAGKKAVESVKKIADKNRKKTVEQIVELFEAEYLN